jgi:Tfp pilus assembly protein PilV
MTGNRGSALLETLIASVILVSGLVSVACIFSVTTSVSVRNQQRTTATLLIYDKMEQLRYSEPSSGGGLNPSYPIAGFMDYVRIGSDGEMTVSTSDTQATYIRLWQVQSAENPTITIAVFAGIGSTVPLELARATGPR